MRVRGVFSVCSLSRNVWSAVEEHGFEEVVGKQIF